MSLFHLLYWMTDFDLNHLQYCPPFYDLNRPCIGACQWFLWVSYCFLLSFIFFYFVFKSFCAHPSVTMSFSAVFCPHVCVKYGCPRLFTAKQTYLQVQIKLCELNWYITLCNLEIPYVLWSLTLWTLSLLFSWLVKLVWFFLHSNSFTSYRKSWLNCSYVTEQQQSWRPAGEHNEALSGQSERYFPVEFSESKKRRCWA